MHRCNVTQSFRMFVFALLTCGAASTSQAQPTGTPLEFQGLASKCLDAQGGGTEDRTPIILFDCHGGPNQLWVITRNGSVVFGIGSNKCLDAEGGNSVNGTRIILFNCHGGLNQQWTLGGPSGPIVGIGGKCIDVQGADAANLTPIILFDCHGGANQQWRTVSLTGTMIVGLANKCLDAQGGSTENLTPIILFNCHGGANQRWAFKVTDPTFTGGGPVIGTIVGQGSGKCLDVQGANAANLTPIILFDCHGGPNQQWTLGASGQLLSLGKCLDVRGADPADRTPIILFDCHPGPNQEWRMQ
jgi:Ricin-type beta-trefoil lectin domain/Ricin-type beta-trefoil lectin domain-like